MKKIIVAVMALVTLTLTTGCEMIRDVEAVETANTPVVETTVEEEPEMEIHWVLDGEEIDPESYIAQQIIAANADRCYYEQFGKHMEP